jgi:hypothetical protein
MGNLYDDATLFEFYFETFKQDWVGLPFSIKEKISCFWPIWLQKIAYNDDKILDLLQDCWNNRNKLKVYSA